MTTLMLKYATENIDVANSPRILHKLNVITVLIARFRREHLRLTVGGRDLEIQPMGEAKRRKAEIERLKGADDAWRATLSPIELQAATIAELAHRRIVEDRGLVSGCYLLAFFLNRYMRIRGIETKLIVGWVNDGETDAMASHAWIEIGGKKIDIALTQTEFPEAQPPGPLLILDRVMRRGAAVYSYHLEQSHASTTFMMNARESWSPEMIEMIENKMFEHLRMVASSRSDQLIDAYLNAAPKDRNYEALARLLDSEA